MIKLYYALVSENVSPRLVPSLRRLLERYIVILDYDNIFKDWIQRPTDYEPTIVTGPKGKVAVIQIAFDILSNDAIKKILTTYLSTNWIDKVSTKVVRSVKPLVKLLTKLGLYDKLSFSIVMGRVAFLVITREDLDDVGLTSPADFVKLFKMGWNNVVIIDESAGTITIFSKKTPKAFVINIRDIENLVKQNTVDATSIFDNLSKRELPKAKAIANLLT